MQIYSVVCSPLVRHRIVAEQSTIILSPFKLEDGGGRSLRNIYRYN